MTNLKNQEIVVQGARANNLKNIDVTIPRDQLVVILVCRVQGNPLSLLTRFMRKVKGVMLSRCHLMPGNF